MSGVRAGSDGRRRGLRTVGFVAVLAVAANLGLASVSSADTVADKKKLDAGIAQLRTALEDTSQDLAHAFIELSRTRALLPGARQAVVAADQAKAAADRRLEAVVIALEVARANEAKAGNALAKNGRDATKVQDQLGNLAREDYQQGGVSGLSIALQADSPEDFTNRMIMMDTLMRVRDATMRGLDTMRAEGISVRAHLVAVRQRVAILKAQAETALARATAARNEAAAAKARVDVLYAGQARYAGVVSAKKDREMSNLNQMKARSDALAAVLAARARAARLKAAQARAAQAARARAARAAAGASRGPVFQEPPIGNSGGGLSVPVTAGTSSEFGWRMHPVLHINRLHEGLDFASGCGSPVRAAADGDVIMALPVSMTGGYGNQLVIDHGLMGGGVDLTTTYNHLTSFVVTGGHVSRGQLVAYSGTTGTSTGCHLHFETREDGIPVNPRKWL